LSENLSHIPQSELKPCAVEEYGEVKFFSHEGRIGRVRYFCYLLMYPIIFFLVPFLILDMRIAPFLVLIIPATIVAYTLISIQRLQDINLSGWFTVLLLIPYVNVVLLFILLIFLGTTARNEFGAPPPPNTWRIGVLSVLSVLFWTVIFALMFVKSIMSVFDL
jgi:uncharacterized membrane protein YhaH (DUF805 family)